MADGDRTNSTGGGDFGGIPGLEDASLPTCYRHPDRETGVSCSNCGRPICPECMTPAPVGFRCPVCMGEQRQGTGRARVITRQQTRSRWQGGMMGGGGVTATKVLIGINVVVFLIELLSGAIGLMGGGSTRKLVDLGALVPALVAAKHEYWRMFASMFLHGSAFHLLFNMWALLVVGDYLESVLGKVKFVVLYLIAGFGGSVFVMLLSDPWTPTVGASGAIFGVFAALAVYAYLNRTHDLAAQMLLRQMLFIIGINVVISVVGSGYISWQAHGGGLVTGAAAMAALTVFGRKDARDRPGAVDLGLLVALVAVLVVLTLWRVQTMVF
jgi:membrane associated rhomboid family serine protease